MFSSVVVVSMNAPWSADDVVSCGAISSCEADVVISADPTSSWASSSWTEVSDKTSSCAGAVVVKSNATVLSWAAAVVSVEGILS